MYPEPPATFVTVEGLTEALCGRSRPGHFRGVATVLAKLFAIVAPDFACFGQKDAAQLAVVRRMVRDLDIPVEIVACPIVREVDGLAMSSRNAYLTPQERAAAPALFRSLERVRALYENGERCSEPLLAAGTRVIEEEPRLRLDYFEIVDPDSLLAQERIEDRALVAVAAFLGTTRLIDNLLLRAQPGLAEVSRAGFARETN
jgi:pantoate--beta-alanine ligase